VIRVAGVARDRANCDPSSGSRGRIGERLGCVGRLGIGGSRRRRLRLLPRGCSRARLGLRRRGRCHDDGRSRGGRRAPLRSGRCRCARRGGDGRSCLRGRGGLRPELRRRLDRRRLGPRSLCERRPAFDPEHADRDGDEKSCQRQTWETGSAGPPLLLSLHRHGPPPTLRDFRPGTTQSRGHCQRAVVSGATCGRPTAGASGTASPRTTPPGKQGRRVLVLLRSGA
jgi:hypothetical protein